MWKNNQVAFGFIVLLAFLSIIQAIKFQFAIQSNSKRCFSQFLTESTPFHFKIQSQIADFDISLNHKDGTPLVVNKREDRTKKIDSYASISAQYNLCILNHSYDEQKMIFSLHQGLQLSDLSALPKLQDSRLINQFVDKINQLYQTVKQQQNYSKIVNQYNIQLQKLVSFKSIGFVFLSMSVVLIISFLHFLEIKRVLKNRKVI